MVYRPIYCPTNSPYVLYRRVNVSFEWNSGFAPIQKKRNVDALHEGARLLGLNKILEISSKSEYELGRRLSSFYLKLQTKTGLFPLESIYQGSKKFENSGPFIDLYSAEPKVAKRDIRLQQSGKIVQFELDGVIYSNEPLNGFYDWIYMNSLYPYRNYIVDILQEADGFSDVEFNPNVSINTQARALAIFITLCKKEQVEKAYSSYKYFLELLNINEKYNNSPF